MRLYVSGPMRGKPDCNVEAFRAATAELRRLGHKVWDPFWFESLAQAKKAAKSKVAAASTIQRDLRWLLDGLRDTEEELTGIVLLEGWAGSVGAMAEATLALATGLRVFVAGTAYGQGPCGSTIMHEFCGRSVWDLLEWIKHYGIQVVEEPEPTSTSTDRKAVTTAQLNDQREELEKLAAEIMADKGPAYTMGSDNRLENFDVVADLLGLTPEQVWAVYFLKQVCSITNWVKTGKADGEGLKSRFTDARVYALLGYAMSQRGVRPTS